MKGKHMQKYVAFLKGKPPSQQASPKSVLLISALKLLLEKDDLLR